MEFAIFSNGLRPHTRAEEAYEQDLAEIVVADEAGYTEAWISEHRAERAYLGKAEVLPVPEMLMCKAAALTSRIRFGSAVRVIHLQHPVDVAEQAAVADNVIGDGRYMFGFGTGFDNAAFSTARGLRHEVRSERTREALELILRCWTAHEPFDWHGEFYDAVDVMVLPKPITRPHMPISAATFSPDTLRLAGERGYGLLTIGSPPEVRRLTASYVEAAHEAGLDRPLKQVRATKFVFIADSVQDAVKALRPGVEWELRFQRERGLLKNIARFLQLDENTQLTFDHYLESGLYIVGDPESVYRGLERFYDECGGFGTLMLIAGKPWATPAMRAESLQRFMLEVAPRLRRLDVVPASAGAPTLPSGSLPNA